MVIWCDDVMMWCNYPIGNYVGWMLVRSQLATCWLLLILSFLKQMYMYVYVMIWGECNITGLAEVFWMQGIQNYEGRSMCCSAKLNPIVESLGRFCDKHRHWTWAGMESQPGGYNFVGNGCCCPCLHTNKCLPTWNNFFFWLGKISVFFLEVTGTLNALCGQISSGYSPIFFGKSSWNSMAPFRWINVLSMGTHAAKENSPAIQCGNLRGIWPFMDTFPTSS